jgi:predicted metal-dependent peptidase
MSTSLEKRLTKARINLIGDLPFFGTLLFKLQTKIGTEVPTACTDGRTLTINPDYAAKLTDAQLAGLLVEEVGHCAMGHLWRSGGREPNMWNKAADQTLWETILSLQPSTDHRIALSPECKWEPRFSGMCAEDIYHLLQQQQQQQNPNQQPQPYQSPGAFTPPPPNPDPSDPGDPGDSGDPSDPSDQSDPSDPSDSPDPGDLEQEWKNAVAEAATVEAQRQRGNAPAWLRKLVADLVEPKVPWQDTLREFCHRLSRDDYSFRRPNRRHIQRGFVLPSLYSESLGPIVLAFDSSGSIFGVPELVRAILSEMQGILDLCRPEHIQLMDCDTQIHQSVEFRPGDDLRAFEPQGGGGTSFRPVFEAIADLPEQPACLVYMTDLEGRFPDKAPDYPVIWANFGAPRAKAPFGTTVHLSL